VFQFTEDERFLAASLSTFSLSSLTCDLSSDSCDSCDNECDKLADVRSIIDFVTVGIDVNGFPNFFEKLKIEVTTFNDSVQGSDLNFN